MEGFLYLLDRNIGDNDPYKSLTPTTTKPTNHITSGSTGNHSPVQTSVCVAVIRKRRTIGETSQRRIIGGSEEGELEEDASGGREDGAGLHAHARAAGPGRGGGRRPRRGGTGAGVAGCDGELHASGAVGADGADVVVRAGFEGLGGGATVFTVGVAGAGVVLALGDFGHRVGLTGVVEH